MAVSPGEGFPSGVSPAGAYQGQFQGTVELSRAESDKRAAATKAVMQGVSGMALEFAGAMKASDMPAEMLLENHYSGPREDRERRLLSVLHHPGWVVMQGTDLSNRPIDRLELGYTTHSTSLLSGTPNNFKKHWEPTTLKKVESGNFDSRHTLRHTQWAVAVTALGEIVSVSKFFQDEAYLYHFRAPRNYTMRETPLTLEDMVETKGRLHPSQILKAMERRFNRSVEHYGGLLAIEAQDGPVDRPVDYYWPKDYPVAPPEQPLRRRIGRALRQRLGGSAQS